MALAEVARFATLSEAHVVCGALEASGFHAVVFDQEVGTSLWTNQYALSGFRLMVPGDELAEAGAFLKELRKADPEALNWQAHPQALSGAPVAALGVAMGDAGWAVAVMRQRFTLTNVLVVALLFSLIAAATFGVAILGR